MRRRHGEIHQIGRAGWLRAAVLGADDGIVSTACLVLGVAASHAQHSSVVIAGLAGLVAGAMSMATGEYVSVSSQADTERAALDQERAELAAGGQDELRELSAIYVHRGLDPQLADEVASQLMAYDALGAHARDELGISSLSTPRPLQAAFASAGSFAIGSALPLIVVLLSSDRLLMPAVAGVALLLLALLGGLAAKIGGAPILAGVRRVTFWSALAMIVTTGVGAVFGAG